MKIDLIIKIFDILGYSDDVRKEKLASLDEKIADVSLNTFLEYLPEDKQKEFYEKAHDASISTETLSKWIEENVGEGERKRVQDGIAEEYLKTLENFYREIFETATEDQKKQLEMLTLK